MNNRLVSACAVLALSAAAVFSSCSKPVPSVAEAAIREHIDSTMGNVTALRFLKLEKIDSTLLEREIILRKGIFKTKLQQDELYLAKYNAVGNKEKAAEKQLAIERDKQHIAQMDSIKFTVYKDLKNVAYYDYCFSVTGKSNGEKFAAQDWYVCMTPDGKIINFVQEKDKLHRGAGVAIPGYSQLFGDKEDDDVTFTR